jgi:hypothetical protein
MAIAVRSPYFIYEGGGQSYQIKITINGTLRYTIFKNATLGQFEIAELIRDYINIAYSGTLSATPETDYVATVEVYLDVWSSQNGTGTGDVVSTTVLDVDAVDGYGYFEDGYNHTTPSSNAVLLSNTTIWTPENTTGSFYYVSSSGEITRRSYLAASTSSSGTGWSVTIKRFPCNKYDPIKLVFVNRFGMPQELWFFAKSVESLGATRDRYKSNKLNNNGSYDEEVHQVKTFNANGKIRYSLSTGYISEDYNEFIQELMLSEQVWAHIGGVVRPVSVLDSDVTYKTSLNDKLVAYTVEIEQANDLISTMR